MSALWYIVLWLGAMVVVAGCYIGVEFSIGDRRRRHAEALSQAHEAAERVVEADARGDVEGWELAMGDFWRLWSELHGGMETYDEQERRTRNGERDTTAG